MRAKSVGELLWDLPRMYKYNFFIKPALDWDLERRFDGLCFIRKYITKKEYEVDESRFLMHGCGNASSRWILMFWALGAFGGVCVMFIAMLELYKLIFSIDEPTPVYLICSVFVYNIIYVNLRPWLDSVVPSKAIYFDRKTQLVGYTYDLPFCTQRDEFGNCCFRWDEISCQVDSVTSTSYGSVAKVPIVYVKGLKYQQTKRTKIILVVTEIAQNPLHCIIEWERICRHMDLTKPLPDSPVYEPFRANDPITAEFDKQNNRPARYWLAMSFDQQVEIKNELLDEAWDYEWSATSEPIEEVVKPWLRWTPDTSKKETLNWKFKIKRLLQQLFLCV